MKVIRQEEKFCAFCMEQHMVETVILTETIVFKNESVEYEAVYEHCPVTNEFFETEEELSQNDIAMKNAYRSKMRRLTTEEIYAIRQKYCISQTDLSILLGWGEKTVARYEGHQVQDAAHDSILRKLDRDPEWFLQLLKEKSDKFPQESLQKYQERAGSLFRHSGDDYLKKSLSAKYADINGDEDFCGNSPLNIGKIVDAIRYFASSAKVTALYKVRLWKMLWYSDVLAFKRYNRSITGLAYCALPMGAVPLGHELILGLEGVEYTEVAFDETTGYHFTAIPDYVPSALSREDIDVLEAVISAVQGMSTQQLVEYMHAEKAYQETMEFEKIRYHYATDLSLV